MNDFIKKIQIVKKILKQKGIDINNCEFLEDFVTSANMLMYAKEYNQTYLSFKENSHENNEQTKKENDSKHKK